MTIWLDANDVNGDGLAESASDFTTIGGKTQVGVWADRSGSNNSFSQSIAGKQPVYDQSGGKNKMLFGYEWKYGSRNDGRITFLLGW